MKTCAEFILSALLARRTVTGLQFIYLVLHDHTVLVEDIGLRVPGYTVHFIQEIHLFVYSLKCCWSDDLVFQSGFTTFVSINKITSFSGYKNQHIVHDSNSVYSTSQLLIFLTSMLLDSRVQLVGVMAGG